ncbi:putative molybdenum carrier protein [Pedosphaera parvula]|nr:putative molybdenum carrier protein [Pedosphaera parvula]
MNSSFALFEKIISGGQTGADRAALDFALAHGIPHGGWCPRGRLAEDGPLGSQYQLTEIPSADSAQRTEWNVRDSDATVIFSLNSELSGGTLKTLEFTQSHGKPLLHILRSEPNPSQSLASFIQHHRAKSLNIAGPRESEEPGIGIFVRNALEKLFLQGRPA